MHLKKAIVRTLFVFSLTPMIGINVLLGSEHFFVPSAAFRRFQDERIDKNFNKELELSHKDNKFNTKKVEELIEFGVSLLEFTNKILTSMKGVSLQACSEIVNKDERELLNTEYQSSLSEINRTASTIFGNKIVVLDESSSSRLQGESSSLRPKAISRTIVPFDGSISNVSFRFGLRESDITIINLMNITPDALELRSTIEDLESALKCNEAITKALDRIDEKIAEFKFVRDRLNYQPTFEFFP